MSSTTPENSAFLGGEPPRPRPRRSLPKIASAGLVAAGVLLVKMVDKLRLFLVNPFEGFGATQYAVAAGSIVVTVVAYALKFRLGLVIGFVLITFIHEVGHAVAIRMKGLRAGYMVFIPFIGGAVTLRDQPRTAYDDALIGLAGPFAGTVASLVSLQVFKWTADPLYLLIALAGFILNLINLLPIGMLDGGRISAAVTKWMWLFGGGVLVYKIVKQPNPLVILILLLALFQVYTSIVREKEDKAFYEITLARRSLIAFAYFALVTFLGHQTYMSFDRLADLM